MFRSKKKKSSFSTPKEVNRKQVAAISPYLMINNWDHLVVNNDYVRTFICTDFPNYLNLNWANIFLRMGDISAPVTLEMKKIPDIRTFINYSANDTRWDINRSSETLVDRKEREYQAEQAEDAAMMIARQNTCILETYVFIKVMGQNKEDLERKSDLVHNRLASYGIECQAVYANQLESFWSASNFLLANPTIERRYNNAAPALTIARGLWNRDIGVCDETGIPLGVDETGGPVRVNNLKNTITRQNGHMLLVGTSGSGKSATLNKFITYWRALSDCIIFINDVEGEYVNLVRNLGGQICSMSSSSAMLISPFEPRNLGANSDIDELNQNENEENLEINEAREQALNARVLATHLDYVTSFILKAFSLDAKDKDIIYHACEQAYGRYGIYKDTTFAEYKYKNLKYPCIKDLYEELSNVNETLDGDHTHEINNIKNALKKAVSGPEEFLWQNSELQLKDTSLVCFDMRGLSSDENMKEAQYYNLLTWEWSQITMNRFSGKKVIVISDELQTSFTASNVDFCERYSDMIRRARKYGAIIVSAMQSVNVFTDDKIRGYGEQVISNSIYKYFGKIAEADKQKVKDILNASNETIEALILNDKRGKFFLSIGNERQCWVNVEIQDWEFELFGNGGGE